MLPCPACGGVNPDDSRFCGECGAGLTVQCPECGASAEPGQRFCRSCATPLTGQQAATGTPDSERESAPDSPRPEAATGATERRLCSVLFADLVGFTPISEARDPEEVRELLSRYFDTARTIVARYGGVVEKFIGDAVMAVWGTPVAVEGDTERAVRAALDLVDGVAGLADELTIPGLRIRAGITTGDVAVNVGAVGEGMVAGDAVNTAARIQSTAGPGEVWVDEATRRLAEAAIVFEDRGEHPLKGKSAPVRLWSATRVVSGVGGVQRVDGLEAPMVGRDAELRTIKELFHATAQRRTPRLVLVAGPAGVGKSRLGWEFEKYVDGLSDTVLWHRGRCLPYGEDTSYGALAEAVRQRLGIAEEDPADVAAGRFAAGLETLIPDPVEQAYVRVRLARLLGIPVDDDQGLLGREELFAGWRLFFERLARQAPVAILVEDAHHADQALLDFLDHLADWARDVPVFVLVFARPELLEAHARFATGRNRSTLALDPLDPRSMDELLDSLVPGMPHEARDQLASRAQGNPLFAVETIRSLVDRDVVVPQEGRYRLVADPGALSVPESLRGVLASRLDALGAGLRSLVAQGAVLGAVFQSEALAAVSGRPAEDVREALAELVRREVLAVVTDPLSPQRGSYEFTQDMLRQVAYDTLSRRDRKALHVKVADHLRSGVPNEGEDVAELVAHHLTAAFRAIPDAPDVAELREQAVTALVRAAERGLRSGAARSASRAYARAAELAGGSTSLAGDRAAGWWEQAASADLVAADFEDALLHAQRAAGHFEERGDARSVARCRSTVGLALARMGRHTEARAVLQDAITVLRDEPDRETVKALGWLATLEAFAQGPDAEALNLEALALAQELDVDDGTVADLFVGLGISHVTANRIHEALAAYQYAARLAERANDGVLWGRALANLADALTPSDPAGAAQLARAACEQARRVGDRDTHIYGLANEAVACLELGEWQRAEDLLERQVEEEDLTDGDVLQSWRCVLAVLRGDVAAARLHARLPALRASEDPQDLCSAALCDALVANAEGRPQDALGHAQSILHHAELLGIRAESVRWAWPLAVRLALDEGRHETVRELIAMLDRHPDGQLPRVLRAERDLARAKLATANVEPDSEAALLAAVTALREAGQPYRLAHGLLDCAEHLEAVGRGDDAAPLLEEARAIADRLGSMELAGRAAAMRQPVSIPADP